MRSSLLRGFLGSVDKQTGHGKTLPVAQKSLEGFIEMETLGGTVTFGAVGEDFMKVLFTFFFAVLRPN